MIDPTFNDPKFIFLNVQDGESARRYDDGGCEKERQCTMCSFHQPPRTKLRGMCDNPVVDVYYTLLWDDEANMPYYQVGRFTY